MQIQDVIYRWCRAAERLDFDEIPKSFHADAIDDHGPYVGDIPGLVAWMRGRHKTITFMMLQVSNFLIEFADPKVALVETKLCTIMRYLSTGQSDLRQLTGGVQVRESVSQVPLHRQIRAAPGRRVADQAPDRCHGLAHRPRSRSRWAAHGTWLACPAARQDGLYLRRACRTGPSLTRLKGGSGNGHEGRVTP